VEAVAFEMGIADSTSTSRAQELESLTCQVTTLLERSRTDFRDSIEGFNRQQLSTLEKAESLVRSQTEAIDATKASLGTLLTTSRDDIDSFKLFVKDELALQAPVDYWTRRASAMATRSEQWRFFFIGSFLFVAVIAIALYLGFVTDNVELPFRLWSLTILLAIVGFLAWPVRIVARLYMSAMHLQADAEERQTMVLTYLALLKAQAIDEKHREIMLSSIFRVSPTGIVSDDSGPIDLSAVLKVIKT